ncbi:MULTISPECIES: hypothetical protein [Actinomadura]|uniref:hypothetical protein n=1 Tax=Actinomadura TaxID=1988 RepID=UPI001BE49B8A|nr:MULTISPECIES: hypothetical protein [Actinomadura]MBT2209142.1 hypothetical protein [Actinomadura sp. NEAU-AAG7]
MQNHEDVLALARAVVKHGGKALLVNEDNSPGGWVSIEEAVRSGKAFAVEPKPGLIAFDLDSPELVAKGVMIKEWAEKYLEAQTVLVASGRIGHRHLWVRLPAGITEEEFKDLLHQNYEFPKHNFRHSQATRPPLSPHREGLSVSLEDPTSVAEALNRLGPTDGPGKAHLPKQLKGKWARLLRDGDTANEYDGRHNVEAAIASAAYLAGLSKEWFIGEMMNSQNQGAAKTQEIVAKQGQAAGIEYSGRTYDNAVEWVTANNVTLGFDHEVFREKLGNYRRVAEQANFQRATDRDVLLALIRHGEKHSSYSPMASVRDLSIESGRAIGTVSAALDRLVTQGWLTRGEPVVKTYTYIFNLEMVDKTNTYSIQGGTERVCTRNVTHPLFTSTKGLAGRAAEVWAKVPSVYLSMSEVTRLTGLPAQQARRAMKRLEAFGLAEVEKGTGPKGGDRYRCLDASTEELDLLADELNLHEERWLKGEQVKRQREAWAEIQNRPEIS